MKKLLALICFLIYYSFAALGQDQKINKIDGFEGLKFGWSKAQVDAYVKKNFGGTIADGDHKHTNYTNLKFNGVIASKLSAYFYYDKLCSTILHTQNVKKENIQQDFTNSIKWINTNYFIDDSRPVNDTSKLWLTSDWANYIQVKKTDTHVDIVFSNIEASGAYSKDSQDTKAETLDYISKTINNQNGKSYNYLSGSVFNLKNIEFGVDKSGQYFYNTSTDKFNDGKFDFSRSFSEKFPLNNATVRLDCYGNVRDKNFCEIKISLQEKLVLSNITEGDGSKRNPEMISYVHILIPSSEKDKMLEAFKRLIKYENP